MAKYNNSNVYPFKLNPKLDDSFLINDKEGFNRQKLVSLASLTDLIANINGTSTLSFKYSDGQSVYITPETPGYFFSNDNEETFADITNLIVNKLNTTGIDFSGLFEFIGAHQADFLIKLRNGSDPNKFAYLDINNITKVGEVYNLAIDLKADLFKGFLENDQTYVFDFLLAGGNSIDENNIFRRIVLNYPSSLPTAKQIAIDLNAGPMFTVSRIENIMIVSMQLASFGLITSIPPVKKYIFCDLGYGVYGNGSGNTITEQNLELISSFQSTVEDILSVTSTQKIILGEIGTQSIESAFNEKTPTFTVQSQAIGYRVVESLRNGIKFDYLFLAEGGIYGLGSLLTASEVDFKLFGISVTDNYIPLTGTEPNKKLSGDIEVLYNGLDGVAIREQHSEVDYSHKNSMSFLSGGTLGMFSEGLIEGNKYEAAVSINSNAKVVLTSVDNTERKRVRLFVDPYGFKMAIQKDFSGAYTNIKHSIDGLEVELIAGSIGKGLFASRYLGANYDNNTYVQKRYVDEKNVDVIDIVGGLLANKTDKGGYQGSAQDIVNLIALPVSATTIGIVNNLILQELGGVDKTINYVRIGTGRNNLPYNQVFGRYSGEAITTGDYNFFGGYATGFKNTSGMANVAVGHNSMLENLIGSFNVAVGQGSLENNNGQQNVAIGASALQANQGDSSTQLTGGNNVAVGSYAMSLNTTGGGNTAVGARALGKSISSKMNVALGHQAGSGITTGEYNIIVGAAPFEILGKGITTGFRNTLISPYSEPGVKTGNNNVFIGKVTGESESASNKIILADNDGNKAIEKLTDNTLLAPAQTKTLITADATGRAVVTKEYLQEFSPTVDISGKVDKETGKSLILNTEILRLSSVTNQTKESLVIENVNNTSDANKPISTAQGLVNNAKLDKVTAVDVEKIYVKNADGTQGMRPFTDFISAGGIDPSIQQNISGNVTATEAMKNKVLIVTADTVFSIGNTILSKDWTVRVIVKNGIFEHRKGTTRIWSNGNPDFLLEKGSDFAIRQEGTTNNLLVSGKFVSNPFIAYFDTRNTISGGSNDKQVRLQFGTNFGVNCYIDWMDGSAVDTYSLNSSTNTITHDYIDAGFKLIKIYGTDFSLSSSINNYERNKICDVLNYGNSFFSAGSFDNCINARFDNTIGIPKFKSNLTTCFRATKFTKINNLELADWSVITRVNFMFNLSSFNHPLRAVNVSNVTDFTAFMSGKSPSDYSADNYDGILNGWSDRSFVPNKSHFFGSIKHTSSATVAKALWTRPYLLVPITNAVNNGAGLMRVTAPLHGMATGNKVFIRNVVGGMGINRAWNVTVIDVNTIDLIDSVYSTAYVSGGEIVTGWGLTITDGGI